MDVKPFSPKCTYASTSQSDRLGSKDWGYPVQAYPAGKGGSRKAIYISLAPMSHSSVSVWVSDGVLLRKAHYLLPELQPKAHPELSLYSL